jgi:phage antirepressor YoqD-like protein
MDKGKLEIKKVNFMGDELVAIRENDSGKIYVGVKWICSGLKFTRRQRNSQISKIQKDSVLSKGARKMMLLTNGGEQETLCIELDYLPLWLAKINTGIISDKSTKSKVVNYQLKCKDILAGAFLHKTNNSQADYIIPQTYGEALQLSADLQKKIEVLEPKAKQWDEFLNSKGSITVGNIAKTMGTGRRRLFKFLRESKLLMTSNIPYQKYIDSGVFTTKQRIVMNEPYTQTLITPRGLEYIGKLFSRDIVIY